MPFRLTREVRFAINRHGNPKAPVTNSYAGYPTLVGFGQYLALQAKLSGELDPATQYLINIKHIDSIIREKAIEMVGTWMRQKPDSDPALLLPKLFDLLEQSWPGVKLDALRLCLSPFLSLSCSVSEWPMVRLSQKFEFSASHRLHNPKLSDEENRRCYGKCNNPHGHGHNYEVQVTLRGEPRENGLLVDVPEFERIVKQAVINRFDHKHLNDELVEFKDLIPSVENIAKVIYRTLKPHFAPADATLANVTVWETPKTWCEYAED